MDSSSITITITTMDDMDMELARARPKSKGELELNCTSRLAPQAPAAHRTEELDPQAGAAQQAPGLTSASAALRQHHLPHGRAFRPSACLPAAVAAAYCFRHPCRAKGGNSRHLCRLSVAVEA